ncbi:hypothetical protein D3C71_1451640 [compost metagenome]
MSPMDSDTHLRFRFHSRNRLNHLEGSCSFMDVFRNSRELSSGTTVKATTSEVSSE